MTVPRSAAEWVEHLDLQPHPEGGYFRETWRSSRLLELDDYDGPRNAGTAIYFLLETGQQSAWHRVASDELWFFHAGDPLALSIASERGGSTDDVELGSSRYQALVPGGAWQSAAPRDGEHGFSLVSCVVVPGFDFSDFEM